MESKQNESMHGIEDLLTQYDHIWQKVVHLVKDNDMKMPSKPDILVEMLQKYAADYVEYASRKQSNNNDEINQETSPSNEVLANVAFWSSQMLTLLNQKKDMSEASISQLSTLMFMAIRRLFCSMQDESTIDRQLQKDVTVSTISSEEVEQTSDFAEEELLSNDSAIETDDSDNKSQFSTRTADKIKLSASIPSSNQALSPPTVTDFSVHQILASNDPKIVTPCNQSIQANQHSAMNINQSPTPMYNVPRTIPTQPPMPCNSVISPVFLYDITPNGPRIIQVQQQQPPMLPAKGNFRNFHPFVEQASVAKPVMNGYKYSRNPSIFFKNRNLSSSQSKYNNQNMCFSYFANGSDKNIDGPYRCEICYKTFGRSYSLTRHKRIHTGEKPYRCDVCNKSFTQSFHLKMHKRTHSRDVLYTCDICSKSFIQANDLKKHRRVHTGEKPYVCWVCRKPFTDSSQLKRHLRVHTGEKPYSCDVCSKSFSQSGTLAKHKKIHLRNAEQ